jgi:hypothetical protein
MSQPPRPLLDLSVICLIFQLFGHMSELNFAFCKLLPFLVFSAKKQTTFQCCGYRLFTQTVVFCDEEKIQTDEREQLTCFFIFFLFVYLRFDFQFKMNPTQVSYYHQKRQKKKMTLYKNEKS